MPPKRSTPLEDPPAASSEEEQSTSSGEEEEDGEEEEGSSSEDEQPQPPPPAQTAKSAVKKPDLASQNPDSDSDSDSGTESESDSESEAVKPIASKPMEETPAKKVQPRSKTGSSQVTAKRANEADQEEKDPKMARKKESESDGAGEKSEDTKKSLFQRLWSEDDEIAVLKGIIEFTEKKGADPTKDMSSFHDFIKKSLHFDVSLNQLKDKVWRLKKKFENHVSKGKKGEDKTFSKAHDQKAFDLWKKIWGSGGILVDWGVKSNGKAKRSATTKNLATLKAELSVGAKESEKNEKMEIDSENHSVPKGAASFDKMAGLTGMQDYVLKRGLDMVDGIKKAEMEEKWRKLHADELELFVRRNELMTEQAKLLLAAYKNE